jgi:DNA-binding protein HU-beta
MAGKFSSTSIIQITTRTITMNKAELIDSITEKTGQTQTDTIKTIDALMETIEATVAKGDKVLLVGFGTFEPHHRAARPGRNPQTGEPLEIAEATLPKFTPGKLFKDKVMEAHKPKPKTKATATGKTKAKAEETATAMPKATAKPKAKPKKV